MSKVRKVTVVHFLLIQRQMLKTTAEYINTFVCSDADLTSLQMYTNDVAHNVAALQVFTQTRDAQQLHDSIMYQDTLVREFYFETLQYIEKHNLINSDNFCCM
jgi:exopolysaccharide biosynthesis protein